MKRKSSKNVLLFLFTSSLAACGGGNGAQEPPGPHSNAYIEIIEVTEQPISCTADSDIGITSDCTLSVTGKVFSESSGDSCGDPLDGIPNPGSIGVDVIWENSYSVTPDGVYFDDYSVLGNASVRWDYRYVLDNLVCASAHWDANDVPLAIGENRIIFTAIGSSGQVIETEYVIGCRIGATVMDAICECTPRDFGGVYHC